MHVKKGCVLFTLREKKLLTKPLGEPEIKIRKLAKKTYHSRSVNKKTIIYTSEAFPAAVASQASKSIDLQTVRIIWFSTLIFFYNYQLFNTLSQMTSIRRHFMVDLRAFLSFKLCLVSN